MAMGRRKARQESLFIPADRLASTAGHPFYQKLNDLLAEADFDRWIERRCLAYYEQEEKRGQPGIPPGVYVRMLLVGYFEGIDSQRGIAWRCADSLMLRSFLGVPIGASTPEHSSLTRIRERLPLEIHEEVFVFVLKLAQSGSCCAARRWRSTRPRWRPTRRCGTSSARRPAKTTRRISNGCSPSRGSTTRPTRRPVDSTGGKKKTSNEEWESASDPESKITKMKDGRTHLGYKAEHAVDLESGLLLSVEVMSATASDPSTLTDRLMDAELKLKAAGSDQTVDEAVADKGYHKAETLSLLEDLNTRTYIPEPKGPKYRRSDHPEEHRRAAKANRRRMRGDRGKRLQKRRSELAERSFAHVCETGGARRTWLAAKRRSTSDIWCKQRATT